MLPRFRKTRDAVPNTGLKSGTQICPIEAWGTLDIYVQTENGQSTITLTEVALVLLLITNLVLVDIALSKGYY